MKSRSKIDLNSLFVFSAVAETGSFTAAADRLGVAKAKVSIQISGLEKRLGTALFARTTRQVSLTEAGQALYGECQPLLSGIQSAVDRVDQNASALTGTLRVNTTVDHAVMTLSPAIALFALKHPDLHIDLRTNDRVVDLIGEGVDVAIRMGWLKDSSLRAVKLDDFQQYVVASPDYIRKSGRPKHPEDLARYDWVTLTLLPAPLTWKFTSKTGDTKTVTVKSRLRVDSPGALRSLLCQGLGFSVLDQYSVEGEVKAGRLRRVLEDWSLPRGGLYAVCPPGPHLSAKARAFIEFYREHIKKR